MVSVPASTIAVGRPAPTLIKPTVAPSEYALALLWLVASTHRAVFVVADGPVPQLVEAVPVVVADDPLSAIARVVAVFVTSASARSALNDAAPTLTVVVAASASLVPLAFRSREFALFTVPASLTRSGASARALAW